MISYINCMSESLDILYLKNKLQEVLDKIHSDPNKRKIKERHDRLSMACPICGDSHKNVHEKRGHLFLNNLYYKCYNEDCRSTFTKLCKDFEVSIDADKKIQLINYIDLNFHSFKKNDDDWIVGNLTKLIKYDDLIEWFQTGKGPLKSFKKVEFGSQVYVYLLDRGIPPKFITENFHEGLLVNGKWTEPCVVFLNRLDDKVLGMQYRNLKSGGLRKFKIFTFNEIYTSIYEEEMDPVEAVSYNRISYLFNIMNIDFEHTITIFEGYLDSIFMPNSIGAVGINTDYSFLTNNDLDVRFFLDNDNIGKLKSNKWLKLGFKVFLWEKLVNDLASKESDPYRFKIWFNKNIKDLNALIKIYSLDHRKLNKYFSNNVFDTIYLNYDKNIKKPEPEKNIHRFDFEKNIKLLKDGKY